MKARICLGVMATWSASVLAQTIDNDETPTELDELVVVAYKQARPVQDVVGDVSVISAEQIDATISQDISNAIKYEANINIEDGGTRFGVSGLNIRGIGGNRVAIEVDGIPNAKTFELGSYSFATASFPEVDLIQNIEILKGPASTLYGSDALGGIVAINTWDPDILLARHPDDNWTQLRMGFDGKRHGRFMTISSAWDFEQHGLLLSATQRDGKGVINENSDLAKDTADWDSQTVFAKWNIDTANGNSWSFGLHAQQKDQFTQINSFIGQGRFARTTALSGEDQSNDHRFSLSYDFNLSTVMADQGVFQAYYANTEFVQDTFENRFSSRGTPLYQFRQFNFDSSRSGVELNFTKAFHTDRTAHQLIYGLEWVKTEVKEWRDASETNLLTHTSTNMVLGENFPLRDFPITDVQEIGLFIHDEITFGNSPWTLVPALRFDHYDLSPQRDSLFDNGAGDVPVVSITDSDFSPKLGVVYDLSDTSNLYAQYVRGFRAPPYDDVNIGFNLVLFNYQAIPNPDLRSEISNGYELGFRYNGGRLNLSANVFYNDYQNLIVSRDLVARDPASGALVFQSRNVENASIYGAELDVEWQLSEQWSTGWQFAWTRGENDQTGQPLNHISPPKAIAHFTWQSTNNRWDAGMYGVFAQSQNRVNNPEDELFIPPGYATFDFIAGHQISKNSQLRLGVYNITNKKYWLWQQVKNFEEAEPIIEALTQASRHVKVSYTVQW